MGLAEVEAGGHPLAGLAGRNGWTLTLGRDHAPAAPIEIVHVATGGANHLAARIDMDDDAQASSIETYVGDGWANRLTVLRLGKSARAMRAVRLPGGSGFLTAAQRAARDERARPDTPFTGAGRGGTRNN